MKILNTFCKLLFLFSIFLLSCSKNLEIDNATMLDGDQIFDPSLYNPDEYLVSLGIENPNQDQKNTPVIITVHGYSASTYEWNEFRDHSEPKANILISQVLLGGHGRTYEEFKNSTWLDWQEPIMNEYNALKDAGYTNINFAGSSTACALMMDIIKEGKIGDYGMQHIFMIDPIVLPSDKLLSLMGLVGPMMGYFETTNTATEEGNWYHFQPQETLNQLLNLTIKVRKDLQNGYKLPVGTELKVYKSTRDDTADAVGAVLIYKGLKTSNGSNINIEMIDSELHVITRLAGRDNIAQGDRDIQIKIFDDMLSIIM